MVLKIFKPEEIKAARETELARDIARTNVVKQTSLEATRQLDDLESRFEIALANQRVRWAKEEEEKTTHLAQLDSEIRAKEKERDELLSPIEEKRKKAENLYQEAEIILESARKAKNEADTIKAENEELQEKLEAKLDEFSEREVDLLQREQKGDIREQSLIAERESIKRLSKELFDKLNLNVTDGSNP